MPRHKTIKKPTRGTKVVATTNTATFVALGFLAAAAASAAFGIASFGMAAVRPAIAIRTSATTPSSAIVTDNTTGVEIARFDVIAGREALLVDRFGFLNCIARNDVDGDCVDRGEVTANLAQASLVTVSYTDSTGTTVTSAVRPIADRVDFIGQTMYVPARSTGTITVYADTTAIDDAGVFSSDRFQVNLNAVTSTFRATGQTTGRIYEEADVNRSVMSNTMALRNTQPTVSLSSSSPSGAASAGFMEALRLNVAADSAAAVGVNRITFHIVTTDDGGSGWANCDTLGDVTSYDLINLSVDPTTPITATFRAYDEDGVACGSTSNRLGYIEALMSEKVPAGSVYTYGLWLDTTGASSVDDDVLEVEVLNESAMEGGIKALTWDDGTARGSAIDGRLVDNLPVVGDLLTF